MLNETILKKKDNKKKNYSIVAIMLVGIILLGGVYAFFQYTRVGDEESKLIAGEVYLHFMETGNEITLNQNAFPETPEEARKEGRTDNILTFTIDGKNTTENKDIYYEIKLLYGENNDNKTRLNDSDLRFDLEETIDGVTKRVLENVSFDTINNTRIWVNTVESGEEIERTYTLRVWISDEVLISDTDINATYTTGEYFNRYATIKVMVYGDFEEKTITIPGNKGEFYRELETSLASYLLEDDGNARILSGGGGYNNGNPVVDPDFKNYVWYSGKLWRIVALNNDGTIKLITHDNITAIQWGANITYYNRDENTGIETKSWIYEWLNEDFLSTLYNYSNIIATSAVWEMTVGSNKTVNPKTVQAPVGILTAYEYKQSYSKEGSHVTGYLNNGYNWWLSSISVEDYGWLYLVNGEPAGEYNGRLYGEYTPNNYSMGVRPCINLLSNIKTQGNGDGSLENPYMLNGDISTPTNNVTRLNERVSGEYVNFDGETYRIVNVENDITKITKIDCLRDSGENIITKHLSETIKYGEIVSSNDYWDYYLNNDWYNGISTNPINYKGMIVRGDWYLGMYPENASYKQTICTSETINQSVSSCTRLENNADEINVYNGYVGIGRVGEIFTTQIGNGKINTPIELWTLSPYSASSVRKIYKGASLAVDNYDNPATKSYGIRPSMFLSSDVIITDGFGTVDSPFEINFAE